MRAKLFFLLLSVGLLLVFAPTPPASLAADGQAAVEASGGPCQALDLSPGTSIDGFLSDQYAWSDSTCQRRSAALVHSDVQDPAGKWGGYMRQYVYSVAGAPRVVNGSSSTSPGFGYTINHFGDSYYGSLSAPGTGYRTLFRGQYHAIHEFRARLALGGGPVDVTIQWFFATGRDHPVWAVTFDSSPAEPDAVDADSRAPYGDLQWDGGAGSPVDGVGWGDRHKFQTFSTPLSFDSAWDYSLPNTVPYDVEWTGQPDAEMGLVQTQTYQQHDAGGYWAYGLWGKSSDSPDLPSGALQPGGRMPADWNWPFQLNQYQFPSDHSPVTARRLAWGTNYGAVGQTQYKAYGDDRTLSGYPYQSYSVFIVLGQHSAQAVAAQVAQVETAQNTQLVAHTGAVVTSGPAGVGRPDAVGYDPPGYNPIFGTWEVTADQNRVDVDVQVGAGTLNNPVFVIENYTASAVPSTILVNGASKQAGADFYPSLDPDGHRLWLTLAGAFSGTTRLQIGPS